MSFQKVPHPHLKHNPYLSSCTHHKPRASFISPISRVTTITYSRTRRGGGGGGDRMGNSIGGKRRTVKVMKIDGSTFKLKPPAQAGDVLRDHPGYSLMESEEVKQLGIRARPLEPERVLKPGKLYFLVELPRLPDQRVPRRAWSGALHVGARERLESLMLSRRAVSDLSSAKPTIEAVAEVGQEGALKLRMRLPKAQVARVVEQSKDAAEAAQRIMELCVPQETPTTTPPTPPQRSPPSVQPGRREKRTRFGPLPDEIIA